MTRDAKNSIAKLEKKILETKVIKTLLGNERVEEIENIIDEISKRGNVDTALVSDVLVRVLRARRKEKHKKNGKGGPLCVVIVI